MKDNEFTGYYYFPGDYEQVAEDAWQVSRRTALEEAFGRSVSATAIAGKPVKGERNDYADGYRHACKHMQEQIRALMEGE